ncbi:molybdopterin-guanine dinucleotide biosynthesis protein B [Campylobacter sp. MIT 99-7217]|uniref:molybdopterin-guanine dinucleotide biosynthesis protein B n=1 Tax=Campylobacter sp. MIT 99-7217 TaxID=535091 RepID=UPI00163CFBD4|nr:molybdopterin-guanine dinucleotide biosynthesis protein B [Campylobacter sp. MIT 99-7217]
MKKLAMAFSGPSNSGKTSLIEKLAKHFIDEGLKVVILKHDPSDKASFDTQGKDSFKFFQSGADTMVLSPTRTTFFSHSSLSLEQCFKMAGEFDLFLVEGLKSLDLPRISVFCKKLDESYFAFSQAIASYEKPNDERLFWLHLDDIKGICEYILKNAKKIKD